MHSGIMLGDSRPSADKRALSIGVLVLNYNIWDLALRALDAVMKLESDGISEYVLFDDGSAAPPPANIDSRIRVILGGVNRGFAGALKVAFAHVKSDIVVLFDADAYPLAPFAERIRERFEGDKRLGQLGFLAQDRDGSLIESFISEPTKWSLLLGQTIYARIPQKAPRPSNLCVFSCCMATRLEAYRDIGGVDEKFDWLDVDIDYSMRLRQNGWTVATDPSLRAFHLGGGTPQLRRHRVLRFYKNRWYLLRKYNLISNVRLARAFILTRLLVEGTLLKVFGSFLYQNSEVLADKILGRQELISYCREHYL
jgi:GT2 family glycosyltransferase